MVNEIFTFGVKIPSKSRLVAQILDISSEKLDLPPVSFDEGLLKGTNHKL